MSNTNNKDLAWEVNSGDLKIVETEVTLLPVGKLSTHPDNRPLGANEEKIVQLKHLIAQTGFDSSHPLVVRPYSNGYQIIEGEHRFRAAKSLGYLKLPCVIRDLDDTEALIQLVLGNIQTESKPLEIGINALKVVQKEGTYSAQEYAKRLGIGETSIRRYIHASEVFQYLKNQLPEGAKVLDEVYKLEEVYRCPQSDWLWLHDLISKNNLSKNQVIEISQSTRGIKTDNPAVYELFDFMTIRQEIAQQILKGNNTLTAVYTELIETIETSFQNLEESLNLYEYNVLSDTIEEENINLKTWFINNLKELKNITKQHVLEAYKDALQLKRSSSQSEAERTASFFRDKKNEKEREEQARIEKEMRQVKVGEWWSLGSHFLYCGEASSADFKAKLPQNTVLAYCNPSNILSINQNENLSWQFDWLIDYASVIAVTPQIEQIQDLFKITTLPYQWSMSAQMAVKKGEATLGSWIYTALFAKQNIAPSIKDTWKIDNSDLKGNKSQDYLKHLLQSFTKVQDIIIDTQAGLGHSFLLCENLARICYGAEANPALCKTIIEKWEGVSEAKARRLGN